jgi:hypothetical protein
MNVIKIYCDNETNENCNSMSMIINLNEINNKNFEEISYNIYSFFFREGYNEFCVISEKTLLKNTDQDFIDIYDRDPLIYNLRDCESYLTLKRYIQFKIFLDSLTELVDIKKRLDEYLFIDFKYEIIE